MRAVHQCIASLFTDRAISYRARQGYSQLKVALSVGIMPMVRSDKACSGVMFTLDTESGFRDVVTISGAYGLGEFVVQGSLLRMSGPSSSRRSSKASAPLLAASWGPSRSA